MTEPRYHSFHAFLRQRFGCKVWRVPVDAGLTCPNRDGTVGREGCIFCNNAAFGPGGAIRPTLSVPEQLQRGIAQLRSRRVAEAFLAYFQPYSNTYASVAVLQRLYEEALSVEGVVGLAIGTRPDCVSDEILDLLERLAKKTFVQLEYGLPSASNPTLQWIGRGHGVEAFDDAMRRSQGRGIWLCGHLIVGLPGEGWKEALHTQEVMVEAGIDGIKYHQLQVVRGSRLETLHAQNPLPLLSMETYLQWLVDLLEALPWHVTVQRLCATTKSDLLVGPHWPLSPGSFAQRVEEELKRRGTRQGSRRSRF